MAGESTGPYLQVAVEAAPVYEGGTPSLGTARYPAFKSIAMDDGIELFDEQDIVRGFLAPMPHLGAAEYKPTVKLTGGHPRPADLNMFVRAALGCAAATSPVVFTPAEPPQSLQIVGASGDSKYMKAQGMGIEELAFKFNAGALEMDVSLVGLVLKPIADPLITPVWDTAAPFRKGDMTLTWMSSSAHTTDFDFKITNPIEAVNEMMVASLYPSLLQYKNDALPTISGTIGKASMVDADVAALDDGTPFEVVIALTRAAMGMTITMPACQLVSVDRDPIEAKRRREGKYGWEARYPAAGGAYATVVFDLTP